MLPMNVQVSVIIPVYNSEQTIERCVESVVHQTYQSIEIIVINDGSTDRTLEKLMSLSERYSQIRIIDQENCGVSKARHYAVQTAGGQYLAFLDSDDYLASDYIECFVSDAEQYHADVCICGYTLISTDGEILSRIVPTEYTYGISEEYAYRIMSTGARFYRTSFWRECDFPVVTGAHVRGEDIPIALLANYRAKSIHVTDQYGYYYVQHNDSARHRMRGLHGYDLPLKEIGAVVRRAFESRETTRQLQGADNAHVVENELDVAHWKFFQMGVIRVCITFRWDLMRGADHNKIVAIRQWADELVSCYMSDIMRNEYLRFSNKLQIPVTQKIACQLYVWVVVRRILRHAM